MTTTENGTRNVVIGPSGARLIIGERSTFKYDTAQTSGRVREQGVWLCRDVIDEMTSAPKVLTVFPDGYEMETLESPNLAEVDVDQQVYDILKVLRRDWWSVNSLQRTSVWAGDDLVDFSQRGHNRYVAQLARDAGCRDVIHHMHNYAKIIDWYDLERTCVHGDPIVDNALYRSVRSPHSSAVLGRDLVLIDPIPPTTALPSVTALDVGRLIQSLVGYESARYSLPWRHNTVARVEAVTKLLNQVQLTDFSVNEARAAVYWSVIHMMRGVRTARLEATRHAVRSLVYVLLDYIVKPWMR